MYMILQKPFTKTVVNLPLLSVVDKSVRFKCK